jgi:Ca-activated chloride channel family protein
MLMFPRRSQLSVALVGMALVGLWSGVVAGQGTAESSTAITVEFRYASGRPASNVSADDIQVLSDGRALEVLGLQSAGPGTEPWQIVLYLDPELSSSRSVLRMFESMADQAESLAALGEVQVVLAGEEPTSLLRSSDPDLLRQTLLDLSLRTGGEHAFRYDRTRFLRRLDDPKTDVALEATREMASELERLRSRRDALIHWLAGRGHSDTPRAMFLLDESQGLDPIDFYREYLADPGAATQDLGTAPGNEALARTLGSYGWTLIPTIVPDQGEEDDERLSLRTNQSVGFTVRLGQGNKEDDEPEPEPEDLRLIEGRADRLSELAAATGGFLLADLESLPTTLERLGARQRLELGGLPRADAPGPISIAARGTATNVLAPRYAGGTPEAVAEVRIRRSLAGGGEAGELPIRAKLIVDPENLDSTPSRLELQADLSSTRPPEGGEVTLRVSVGVHQQDGALQVHHELVQARFTANEFWSWEGEMPVPPTSDAAVVVIADLEGDLWGENFAEFVTVAAEASGEAATLVAAAPTTPSGPALLLMPLPASARSGKIKVRTQASPAVDEVVFLLDGERVGRKRRGPFEMKIDLGRVPVQRSIIAIAYDSTGAEVGRDGLVVNEAATNFWVNITEPLSSDRVGPVDVEASLKLPDNRRLESMQFFWNDRRIDTTSTGPFRTRVLIPVDSPAGYIRVVATLDDGSTAEDVVLMNTQRFESAITVELVELYVVVTDKLGKPVQGLDKTDFLVREEAEVQNVESFSVAGNLPLTLGLAIDSSLSLFKKMPEVQDAATRFVNGLESDRDRAFLVGFGSAPRTVHPVTGNLNRIVHAIDSLEPSGNTAVWEAISLSLAQLNEANGRKALVVFYDGDDEDEQYSFKKTMDLARKSRIPIYLIVMNDEAARTQGKGFSVRSRVAKLDQLSRAGGGRVFYVRTDQDLKPIFEDIAAELRSHYLLTYYPQRPLGNPEWRPIHVEMTSKELEARTISGYGGG